MSSDKKNPPQEDPGIEFEFDNLDGSKTVEKITLQDGWLVAGQSSGSSGDSGCGGDSGSGDGGGGDGGGDGASGGPVGGGGGSGYKGGGSN